MMKNAPGTRRSAVSMKAHGFSLLEVIVAMVLIATTGALMFPVMRTNLTKSTAPVNRVDDQYLLIREMDRLTGLYRREIQNDTLDINSFKTTHVDTSAYVYAAETGLVTLNAKNYGNTVSPNILRVTLVNGDLKIATLFTE